MYKPLKEFKFNTRKQTVNTMEGQTRVKLNYLQQLQMFHAQQGKKNFVKPPLVDRTPIDLHLLAKVVEEKGGPEEVYTFIILFYLLRRVQHSLI